MFLYLLDQLPRKVTQQINAKGDMSEFAQGKIFCREDLEETIRDIIGDIKKHLIKKVPGDSITYRDFSKKLYQQSGDSKMSLEESVEDESGDKKKDKTSSLFKFMNPDGKSNFSSSYLIELIQTIIDYRKRFTANIEDDYIKQKHESFCFNIRTCIEVNTYFISVGIKNPDELENQLRFNFFFQQLAVMFLKSFEKSIIELELGHLSLEKLKWNSESNIIKIFGEKPFSKEQAKYSIDPLVQKLAGSLALKMYNPGIELTALEKSRISHFLKSLAGSKDFLSSVDEKRNELIGELFIRLQEVLKDYEKSCEQLIPSLKTEIEDHGIQDLLTENEKKILVKINFLHSSLFEQTIPRWENLLPLPSSEMLSNIINNLKFERGDLKKNQVRDKPQFINATNSDDASSEAKFDIELKAFFNDLEVKLNKIISSESRAGIQLTANDLSKSPPKDHRTNGLLFMTKTSILNKIQEWQKLDGLVLDNKDKNDLNILIDAEILQVLVRNQQLLEALFNEPMYSCKVNLRDIFREILDRLQNKLIEMQKKKFKIP